MACGHVVSLVHPDPAMGTHVLVLVSHVATDGGQFSGRQTWYGMYTDIVGDTVKMVALEPHEEEFGGEVVVVELLCSWDCESQHARTSVTYFLGPLPPPLAPKLTEEDDVVDLVVKATGTAMATTTAAAKQAANATCFQLTSTIVFRCFACMVSFHPFLSFRGESILIGA